MVAAKFKLHTGFWAIARLSTPSLCQDFVFNPVDMTRRYDLRNPLGWEELQR
jgi:hypothetical protein